MPKNAPQKSKSIENDLVTNKNIIAILGNNVAASPSNIAIYDEEGSIDYQELHNRSNQLAHYIFNHKPNLVGNIVVYMDRCVDSIICLLAVMQSNNTYVPIDYEASPKQFEQIINDCNPLILLTKNPLKKSIEHIAQKHGIFVIDIGESKKLLSPMPLETLPIDITNPIAYILYTSGTTGKPKGVQITHVSLINFLFSMKEKINFTSKDVFLAITPITFDISAAEIYIPLLTGASLVFVENYVRYEPNKLQYFIAKFNVSIMQATPITWQMLIENGWKNESKVRVVCGGEALSINLARKLRAISYDVWNFYGPTETTVWSTFYKIDGIDETRSVIAIGKPLANTEVYVLNEKLQQLPVGEPGELYIGGAGVAVGYLNRPELNKKCFISNPFSQAINDRLYKTGDLVIQDKEGNLHYLGRIDTQIKIRGHRIEASAIENVVMDYQGIKECVVIDKNPEQQHELVAYLILSDGLSLKSLQEHLKAHFPSYMIPTRYVVVDEFPVTANGKIDRKNIANIKKFRYLNDEKNKSPLENRYEEVLMDLIQSFLQRDDIDPESNFFDIGLHSMLLVNIAQALNRVLSQPVSVVDLFEHPTIRGFAKFLLKTHHIQYEKEGNIEVKTEKFLRQNQSNPFDHHIAVIGMACKVPGADDYNSFWDLIIQQKESIAFFSEMELEKSGIPSEVYSRKEYVPARGILDDIDKFDAAFFGYTPAEARIMDPQHRVFLEQSWSALEDAGYCANNFSGKIGIYAGMNDSTYLNNHLLQNDQIKTDYDTQQLLLATSTHYLSTKVAYALGLKGPSITINTACSTGLVSIAMACNSLVNHDCDMTIAGAVTIVTPQQTGYLYQELGILSPDGHCRVFDGESQGTVLSNGCGVVVLKRLTDSLKDNDRILGVIKGWAINNDGANKVGFTAPSVDGQVSCVREALLRAEISPTEVEYIEAHGTGTLMGDPIEIASLRKAYDYDIHQKSQYCALGSVKANIGHTDSASGTIGFIKTILALHHKILPPQINYVEGNPNIDFDRSPYYVNCETRLWETTHKKRTAAVHSLGFGGTNAHVIVQEAPDIKTTHSKGANVLVVSAKTEQSLQASLHALYGYILNVMRKNSAELHLADLAYTLQLGRQPFKWRTAIAYQNFEHVINVLKVPEQLKKHTVNQTDKRIKRIIFGFTGQGSQYAGMAFDIYREHPYFKQIIDECCICLQPELGIDLRNLLFPKTIEETQFANEQLRKTQYTQPALFVIEYALAKFLISLGIIPHAMIGHSIGEYVAATLSGVLTLKDSLKLVASRGKLMTSTNSGSMLVVPLSIKEISPYLSNDVELVAYNAPSLNVVAGTKDKISQFEKSIQPLLNSKGMSCKTLFTSHAFHSHLMDPILESFYELSSQLVTAKPSIPYVSNVTGHWVSQKDVANKRYWTKHLRHAVLFSKGVDSLNLCEEDVFIEVGPGCGLTQLIRQHKLASNPLLLQTLGSATEFNQNSYQFLLSTLGKLWLHHLPLDWEHLYTNEIRQRCALPTYAFERNSYWVHPIANGNLGNLRKNSGNILYRPVWKQNTKLPTSVLLKEDVIKKCLIIFCDDKEKCALFLEEKLKGVDLYIVSSGLKFQRLDGRYMINPEERGDYALYLSNIKKKYNEYYVIHLWLSDDHPALDEKSYLSKGVYSLLYLTQAFNEVCLDKSLKVLVVTTQVHSVLGSEDILPVKSTILGPCKVIPQEQDNMAFRSIDLESGCDWGSSLIKNLYWEADTILPSDFKEEVAYRGKYRWIKKLEPCDRGAQVVPYNRLKKQGVYVITGGLGGVGLSIAEHLAKNYNAHVVLLTRSEFPLESEWQDYLDNKDSKDHKHDEKIKRLVNIKKDASTLTIEFAAVENFERLQLALQRIKKRFHKINGVIHAAGLAGGGLAQLKTIEAYEHVLKPKLEGTHNLMQCLKDEPLDMMVLMSSITAITGFPGQIDYCSANSVLDAYAGRHDNFNNPVFCVAMNWLAWREVGMAAESKTLLMSLDESNSISAKEGCDIFEKIVNSELNQVIISKEDLNFYAPPAGSLHEFDNNYFQGSNVIDALLNLWQQILGVDRINIDDDFYEIGGHSLLAVSLLSKIRHQFDVKIPSTTLFHVKTIRALATVIESYKQEQEEYSPLVVLCEGDASKAPLFMVHPVGGTVFCYMQLANMLDTDRTIYAFQDPSIEAEKSLFSNIEEMAVFYLEHIQKIQAQGPYYLCGASFGSLVVTEMAYLLEQKKEIVKFIGIIDGWAAHGQTDFDINYVREIINLNHPNYQENLQFDKQPLWESLLRQRLNMMLCYQYKHVDSPMIIFKAIELLSEYKIIDSPDNHWSKYASSVSVRNIPGDHNTMMLEPNVVILSQEISKCLNKVPKIHP